MQLGKYFSQESRDTHSSDGRTVHIWSVDRVRSSNCKQEKEERRSLVNSSPRLPCKFTRQTAWLAVPAYLNLQGEKQIPNHFLPYPPLKIWFSFNVQIPLISRQLAPTISEEKTFQKYSFRENITNIPASIVPRTPLWNRQFRPSFSLHTFHVKKKKEERGGERKYFKRAKLEMGEQKMDRAQK